MDRLLELLKWAWSCSPSLRKVFPTQKTFTLALEILSVLLNCSEGLSVTEITSRVSASRSNVQRILQRLFKLGLVERRPGISRSGGYVYIYYTSAERIYSSLKRLLQRDIEALRRLVEMVEKQIAASCLARTH